MLFSLRPKGKCAPCSRRRVKCAVRLYAPALSGQQGDYTWPITSRLYIRCLYSNTNVYTLGLQWHISYLNMCDCHRLDKTKHASTLRTQAGIDSRNMGSYRGHIIFIRVNHHIYATVWNDGRKHLVCRLMWKHCILSTLAPDWPKRGKCALINVPLSHCIHEDNVNISCRNI